MGQEYPPARFQCKTFVAKESVLGSGESVTVEDEAVWQVLLAAEQDPPNARVHQAIPAHQKKFDFPTHTAPAHD